MRLGVADDLQGFSATLQRSLWKTRSCCDHSATRQVQAALTVERSGPLPHDVVFAVAESLAMTLADDPWFAAFPTPVLAFPTMPLAYFLVRPPMPSVLLSREAHAVEAGIPMPLPPSALDTTPVIWLVTPEQAGNRLVPGDALADLIYRVEGECA